MNVEYLVLGIILAGALYLFWTQQQRTDVTALLVMLALILPWPHPDGRWRGILTYQEGFSGFGSPAVIMVTAMFVLGAAMVRTGAAERLGGKLFRACAGNEILLQAAILVVTTIFSMFVNDTTVVLVFLPIILAHVQGAESLPVPVFALRRLRFAARGAVDAGRAPAATSSSATFCASIAIRASASSISRPLRR